MSTSGNPKADKEQDNEQKNATIEIKISIPPVFGGNIGGLLETFGKAASEVAKVGRSFISTENKEAPKMRKIEIK